jgi:hypothetical protein
MDNQKHQGNQPDQGRSNQNPGQTHNREKEKNEQQRREPQPIDQHGAPEEKKAPGQNQGDMGREKKRA